MIAAKSRFNCFHKKPPWKLESALDAFLHNSSKMHYRNTAEKYNDIYMQHIQYYSKKVLIE